MLGDRKTVVLRGGAPWGFRLAGGGQIPVYIAKVRSRSKAALGGLAAGDSIISTNGLSAFQQSLREINDIIDTIRDQLVLEVQSTTSGTRGYRLDSGSSVDTRENSPIRPLITRITTQPKQMDYYQYSSARTTPTYPSYTNYSDQSTQHYTDSYGRVTTNPLPSLFRTATITTNSPSTPVAKARVQQFSNYRPTTSHSTNSTYDTPRNYNDPLTSGYASDTNELRRSSISIRPTNGNNIRSFIQSSQPKVTVRTEQNYFSDSECVTSGPRYYKISRQVNTIRRPSNIVLPIRSMTSKAYEQYIPSPEQPKVQPKQQPFDVYRYQQERERQEQLQRQAAANRYNPPPKLSFPTQTINNHEIGAELLKSPITNKKRYADSTFFNTAYNTYPTIEEQKKMAHQIAAILEGGDPSQKVATKFEKQRQRAEKYTLDSETNHYRPLRPLQTNESSYSSQQQQTYYNTSNIPNCVKNSLEEAQYINPLRYVGAPEEFKQIHMQEHVTHTNIPPQVSMNLAADLNFNLGKGAALFQKRKARADKWVIDENNVKKAVYPAPSSPYVGATTRPWGQRAPSWSDSEGPNNSPVRGIQSPSPVSVMSPTPVQNGPRFGDFNAKPKGFGSWNSDNQSPRANVDGRKQINLNIEPSIREGIAESHTRTSSQPWSPNYYPQNQFNYPTQQYNGTSTNRYSSHFTDL